MNKQILEQIERNFKDAKAMRHYLHEHPEIATKEVNTSRYLKNQIQEMGMEIEEVPKRGKSAGNGFIAILDTGRQGKTVGLRTDIDALPMQENPENLAGPRSVISKEPGVMHACGHDGHMTTLMYSMKILNDLKDKLSGKVIFIFEEGEEIGSGIEEMIKLLETKEIDALYGNHLAAFLDTGQVAADPGPVMTAASIIDFKVIGRGGHGSRPDLAINPLYAGVDILNSISVAWNNQISLEEVVSLGITQFHVGSANNVIADEANVGGTIRFFNAEEGEKAYQLLMKIAKDVAHVHNCRIEENPGAGPLTLPILNDEKLAGIVQSGINELFPGQLVEDIKWYASETFANYATIAPYVLSFVGIRNEKLGSGADHHNEYFDMDDEALKYAIGAMTKFTIDYLTL